MKFVDALHCQDMKKPTNSDDENLIQGRIEVDEILDSWLEEEKYN